MRSPVWLFVSALFVVLAWLPRPAQAFCGFYVSGADARLQSRATHVVLMRSGTRTVLSMQNAYEGPPQDFAMVVPVPVVLQKEQVKTLPREVLDRVDQLGAPRLVEYWEQDPCKEALFGIGGTGQGFGTGSGRLGGSHSTSGGTVTVEAQFAVGEYEIVILSATDSTALDTWLRENKYRIPEGSEPLLRPYVQAGMKFFVAKVDIAKVTMKDGRAVLSPLRFHYDSDTFSLPIRLGLINAGDAQDLIVSILARSQRYEVANYPNVAIPTNLDVKDATRTSFGSFYAALFDETLRQKPGAVVTEYAWDAGNCDPCPGPTLSGADLATLGADVSAGESGAITGNGGPPSLRLDAAKVTGRLPPEVIQRILRQNFGRFRLCYENGLRNKPALTGRVGMKLVIGTTGDVAAAIDDGSDLPDPAVVSCMLRAVKGLSFPAPEGGIVTVRQGIQLAPGGALTGPRSTNVVLTRLHMRYSKETLGEDLVFKAAAPVRGGREVRSGGGLESGAVLANVNNFQARYAIRHPWTGPITCDKPVRGRWGGRPDGDNPGTQAARDLAFVKRDVTLASFLDTSLPPVSGPTADPDSPAASSSAAAPAPSQSPTGSAAPPAASAEPPASSSPGACGCRAAGDTSHAPPLGLALSAIAILAATRRRKRRAAPRWRRR